MNNATLTNDFISKHAKYHTRNPISRYLVTNFYQTLYAVVARICAQAPLQAILDVGCGEGFILNALCPLIGKAQYHAIDIDPGEVADARLNLPFCHVQVGSAYEIPLPDTSVDLVICTEVLEHLQFPEKALQEFHRVSRRYALLSVPREPIWRALNMVRGAYWADWGNTPDHCNHWSRSGFQRFVSPYFRVISCQTPLPWTMLLAEKLIISS